MSDPSETSEYDRANRAHTDALLASLQELQNELTRRVDQLGQAVERLRGQAGDLEHSVARGLAPVRPAPSTTAPASITAMDGFLGLRPPVLHFIPVQSTPEATDALAERVAQQIRPLPPWLSSANASANANANVSQLTSTSTSTSSSDPNPNPNPNRNRNPTSFSMMFPPPDPRDNVNRPPLFSGIEIMIPSEDLQARVGALYEGPTAAMLAEAEALASRWSARPASPNGMAITPPEGSFFQVLWEPQAPEANLSSPPHSHSHSHRRPPSQPASHPEQSRGERSRRTQTTPDSTRSRSQGCPPTNLEAVRTQPAPVVVKSDSISPASPASTSATISPPAQSASIATAAQGPPTPVVQTAQRVETQTPQPPSPPWSPSPSSPPWSPSPPSPSHDDTSLTYRGMDIYNRLNPSSHDAPEALLWLTLDPADDDMLPSMPAPRSNRRSPPHLHQPLGTPATSAEEELLHQVHTLEVELLQMRLNANSRRLSVAEQRFRERDPNTSAGVGAGGNAPSDRLRESEQRLRDAEARLADTERRLRRTRSARDDVLGVEEILSQLEDPSSVDSTVRIRQLREDRTASRNRLETRLRELAEVRRAASRVGATATAPLFDPTSNIEQQPSPGYSRLSRYFSFAARANRDRGGAAPGPGSVSGSVSGPRTESGRPGHQLVDWARHAEGNESVVQAASRRLNHYYSAPRDERYMNNPGATRGIERFVDMLDSVESDTTTARDVNRDDTMERLAQAIVDSADGIGNDEEEEEQRRERQRRRSVQRSLRGGAVLEARGEGRSVPPQAPLPRRATWAEVNEPEHDGSAVQLGPVPAPPRRQRPYISMLDL